MTERLFDRKIVAIDAQFERWLERNPRGKFSTFSAAVVRSKLVKGHAHATLGVNLSNGNDWLSDGIANCDGIYAIGGVGPDTKICDYGCGSLRVGVHLIERQMPGCYFGLDVSEYLIALGAELIGEDAIKQKRPVLGSINKKLAEVIDAAVDVVFSFNVASHIHPDEQDTYVNNLKAICHKPGARLTLNVLTHRDPIRFQPSGWAWTIDHYTRWLAPLTLIKTSPIGTVDKEGIMIDGYLLTFQR